MKKLSVLSLYILIALLGPGSTLTVHAMPSAPTFTVNSTADVAGYPGDLACETAPGNGVCTLRAAIMAANHLPGGGATVKIPPGFFQITIPPSSTDDEASGDFNLTNPMTLVGNGELFTTLDGKGLDRVLTVAPNVLVHISGVTIENGNALNSPPGHLGGGVYNQGTLILNNVIITANTANQGGGIYSTGPLILDFGLVNANSTPSVYPNFGGGIVVGNSADVQIVSSTIIANTIAGTMGSEGAGIYCTAGTLSVTNTTIKANTITGTNSNTFGGGVFSDQCAVTINGSTISGNNAPQEGGGFYNFGSSATLLMVNSTVYGNYAATAGGGIVNDGGVANLYSSTVAANEENNLHIGAGILIWSGTLTLANTIVANNFYPIATIPYIIFADCYGILTSQNYNLMTVTRGCGFTPQSGDRLNVAAELGLLGNYGGPTQTVDLVHSSPAIGAGSPTGCQDGQGSALTTDQRGYPRKVFRNGQLRCDIGAYQAQLNLFLPLLRK